MIPSMATEVRRSMAKPDTETPYAVATLTPSIVTDIAGLCWQDLSTCLFLPAVCTSVVGRFVPREENRCRRGRCPQDTGRTDVRSADAVDAKVSEISFVFAGDNAYGSHAMARFAYRHRGRISLVIKIVSDANLIEHPPK